jgi:hypothetical protein
MASYHVLREIGRGGTAIVYEVEHSTLRHRVAIKMLRASVHHDPAAIFRFSREPRLMASLNRPHVLWVYDYVDRGRVFSCLGVGGVWHPAACIGRRPANVGDGAGVIFSRFFQPPLTSPTTVSCIAI